MMKELTVTVIANVITSSIAIDHVLDEVLPEGIRNESYDLSENFVRDNFVEIDLLVNANHRKQRGRTAPNRALAEAKIFIFK